jgi:formylglycine-generating enzyme required for sulfatase activity
MGSRPAAGEPLVSRNAPTCATVRLTTAVAEVLFVLSLWVPAAGLAGGPVTATAPEGMVLVPAGPFTMGNNNDFHDSDNDEKPQHTVDLPAFYIDKYPVSNREYAAFMKATGHGRPGHWSGSGDMPAGKEEHPVVGVTYADATAYAQWMNRRLPTEQEFEKACRGTDARRWTWGNVFDKSRANVGQNTTTPVTAYPTGVSPYGAFEMAGNVWEWNSSWYELYPGSPPNRTVERFLGQQVKSVRGGSYGSDIGSARCADRGHSKPDEFSTSLGFRTALDVPGYEHYADAVAAREQARSAGATAALDITEYEEHQTSTDQIGRANDLLARSDTAFEDNRFEESERLASDALGQITQAHEQALDYKRQVILKKEAETGVILDRLENALTGLPDGLSPQQQALKAEADKHLHLGRQFQEEGGWGYAQMHGIIGYRQVEAIGVQGAAGSTP